MAPAASEPPCAPIESCPLKLDFAPPCEFFLLEAPELEGTFALLLELAVTLALRLDEAEGTIILLKAC